MRHCPLAAFADGPLRAGAKACDGRVDCAFAHGGHALCDGEVFPDEAAGMELGGQKALGMRMPRNAQKAARALVKPVDRMIDKGAGIGAEHGDHLIAQRGGCDMAGGQGGQRRALGDDQQILVLIADRGRRQAGKSAAVG